MPTPYVAPELYERWRSKDHVGIAKPTLEVTVTRGVMDRDYQKFEFLDGKTEKFMTIVNGNNVTPWQAFWRPTGDPIPIPNVLNVKWQKLLESSKKSTGATATIEIENVIMKQITGAGGIYHAMKTGYLSPWLGSRLLGRLKLFEKNEWFERLIEGMKIDIFEGYGDQKSHTFTGLIETVDLETFPYRITVTARDFSILFTDQRIMEWNKPPECRAPITVADRQRTYGIKPVGYGPKASSVAVGRKPERVVEKENTEDWVSSASPEAKSTQWIEVKIPAGYYEEVYLDLPYKHQKIYMSIFAEPGSYYNGEPVVGWVSGPGKTPDGTNYVNKWSGTSSGGIMRSMGAGLEATAGSLVRITFTNLSKRSEWGNTYRAGCTRLAPMLFGHNSQHPLNGEPGVNADKWILIDDFADIAKTVFMWCGLKEWAVESLGYSLVYPMKWDMSKFFAELLENLCEQANWVFYMGAPSTSSETIGVPVFERNKATDAPPAEGMLEIRDEDMLESVQPALELANLPYFIYVRGNVDQKGLVWDEELVKRYEAVYFPPWAGAGPDIEEAGRVAGVRRHSYTVDANFESDLECEFGAVLIAIQYALEAYGAKIQIAGYPGIDLNEQISIISESTGINSRLWTTLVESEHTTGEKAAWKMTVGGSLIDNEDLQLIRATLFELEQKIRGKKTLKDIPGLEKV